MLETPRCFTRSCKHYTGVYQPDETEMTERNVCEAFPEQIPDEIAYGNNLHLKPLKDQSNTIVYEKEA